MCHLLRGIEWQRLTAQVLATSIMVSGCVTPKVYDIGVKYRRMEFQTLYIAHDGDILLDGELFQNDRTYKRYAYKDVPSWHEYLHIEARNEGDTIRVDGPASRSVGANRWKIIPSDFRQQDATQDQVPEKFFSTTQVYSATNPAPYSDGGKTYYLKFDGTVRQWGERAGWSYPLQILLVPAAAIDLVCGVIWVPIWFILFSREH